MDFRTIRIPYAGRDKYGLVGTGDAVRSIINNYMGTGGGGGTAGGDENRGGNSSSFFAYLSKTSNVFDGLSMTGGNWISDYVYLYGFKNMTPAQTLVGDISYSGSPESHYDIQGLPASGMSVTVHNNGGDNTYLDIQVNSDIYLVSGGSEGTLIIPVAVNINDNPLDPYQAVWNQNQNLCMVVNLTYSWSIDAGGSSSYVMDLSNEKAGVNCDSAGTIYSASTETLVCKASLYVGTEPVSGATFDIFTDPRWNARGVSANTNTGDLIWDPYTFQFLGSSLPIEVRAYVPGKAAPVASKIMTITKNYPGADGAPAVTTWINTSVSQVLYNPNKTGIEAVTPSAVTAEVWKQIGYQPPQRDYETPVFYGYSTENPTDILPAGVAAESIYSEDYISFALRLGNISSGSIYEMETVPIIPGGLNGESGATGASGKSGTDGESAWYLTLDNDNATVNCDADGNIIQTSADRITCHGKLYHGNAQDTGANYLVSYGTATGVVTGRNATTGVLSISFNNLSFTGDNLTISVSGYGGDVAKFRDAKVMNITKSYAGASGEPAVSYWVEVSTSEVLYDPNKSGTGAVVPSSVSATAKMMKGALAPSNATGVTMEWCKISRTTGAEVGRTSYTPKTIINPSTADCTTYKALRFYIFKGVGQVDMEEIPILKNGLDGSGQTRTGAAIRGPYDYAVHSGSTRCWCAGEETQSTQGCDCEKWIDVMLKDGKYYYCNESYYGTLVSGFNNDKWTEGDSFDFVAAGLILASGASINFLTNNELYLRDEDGDITGGAAGGSGITFWAGEQEPGDAPFKVNNDGTLVATKGTFGPFTIGTDEDGEAALVGTVSDYESEYTTYINPVQIRFEKERDGLSSNVRITLNEEKDPLGLVEANFSNIQSTNCGNIPYGDIRSVGFYTNGNVDANRYVGTMRSYQDYERGFSPMCNFPLNIVYLTDDVTLFTKEGVWYINNQNTGISTAEDKSQFYKSGSVWYFNGRPLTDYGVCVTGGTTSSIVSGLTSQGTLIWHFNGVSLNRIAPTSNTYLPTKMSGYSGLNAWKNGWWDLPDQFNSYPASPCGIASSNIAKKNNVIYIEL